ncbi:MAG: transposase [Oscillospiraceae bacterium]|nr:transposase [Oscillospiraceae bacterium]
MMRDEVKTVIFRYVFGYYNTILVTSFDPDWLPPVAYREMYLSQGIGA